MKNYYHFVRTILSIPFCPYHFVPYHFVRTILSVPLCPVPFCPVTTLATAITLLFCSRVPGSPSSESATNSAPLADVSSTSLDRDGDHDIREQVWDSLYSEMRISPMFAVKSKRSWTSTLFSCV